jgi:hypothetical protein
MEVNHLHQEWDLNSLEMELILQIWFRWIQLMDSSMIGTFSQWIFQLIYQQHLELLSQL